ncbi:hypothetical protein CEXT_704311 [Caerostris extrusa]|uniref:Uncharacterized protein n=1 Tax=Caerostris extrusa TaxID=172846 RepID=A0AAV4Q5U6_CAEEX|nr:hypothetical protein CEXT_704311 [Caerostris extrusa]
MSYSLCSFPSNAAVTERQMSWFRICEPVHADFTDLIRRNTSHSTFSFPIHPPPFHPSCSQHLWASEFDIGRFSKILRMSRSPPSLSMVDCIFRT